MLDFSKKVIIGMIHLKPLILTSGYTDNLAAITQAALDDARTLVKGGVDAIMIENMGDTPLKETLSFEQALHLMNLTTIIKREVNLPVGIDAAFNDYKASLAIAKLTGASFVRIPVYVDTVLFHGGIIKPVAAEACEYRKAIGATNVKILADLQVKYTDMLVPISIEASAKRAAAALADCVIVTGSESGDETPIELIARVKKVVNIPVLVGSGINSLNINEQFEIADGAIVGTSLKDHQLFGDKISLKLTKQLVANAKGGK